MKSSAISATLLCCTILVPVSAYGDDTTTQCISSLENGQMSRKDGRLQEAKKAFTRCAERECPSSLQLACGKFLDEVDRAMPSLVFSVTIDGEDTIDAHIEMDGAPLTDKIDARGIEVEPGLHTFVIKVAGFGPVERKLLVREGEQRKNIQVPLMHPKPAEKPAAGPPEAAMAGNRPIPLGVWVTGAIGVAGLALGATFEAIGEGSRNHLNATCSPRCSDLDINAVRSEYLVGDIALGVGAAGAIAAAVWYFARPTRYESAPPPAADRPSVSVLPGVNSLQLKATF